MAKLITIDSLKAFLAKLQSIYVAKELKTGSKDAYKVLSDNNLTDELVAKINAAGAGGYDGLTGKPAINGHELASGDNTLAALGIEAAGAADKAKTELQEQIAAAAASAYNAKGSTTFDRLPAVADAKKGDVWNISDAFTTTDDFVEGAGKQLPAGTNVIRVDLPAAYVEGHEPTTVPKWDAAAGMTDLSAYALKSDLAVASDDEIDALFA